MAVYDFKIEFELEHAPAAAVSRLLMGLSVLHAVSQLGGDDDAGLQRPFLWDYYFPPSIRSPGAALVVNRLEAGSLVGQVMDWIFGDRSPSVDEAATRTVVSAIEALPGLRRNGAVDELVQVLRSDLSVEEGSGRSNAIEAGSFLLALTSAEMQIREAAVSLSSSGSVGAN